MAKTRHLHSEILGRLDLHIDLARNAIEQGADLLVFGVG